MDENKEELATLESLDSGAVYTLALKTHIGMSVDTFRYFAGWCDKIQVHLGILVYYNGVFEQATLKAVYTLMLKAHICMSVNTLPDKLL